ncbi:MAG: hypothetical protein KDK89_01900 [Alphaproteobacteria bacterium]|nr:hypothetical protein [Alphaproteobacteria bacterium]
METWQFMWGLATCWGLVAAGLVGSGWAMITGNRPSLSMIVGFHATSPLRGLVLAVYAPLAICRAGLQTLHENPAFAILLLLLGTGWSFMQGVFIMTTLFGFT